MARRTKQKSIIDRRKRSSNFKRAGAVLCVAVSALALYVVLIFCINNGAVDNQGNTDNLPSAEVKETSTVILLTTPTPDATTEVQSTQEPTQTIEPMAQ